MFKHVGLLEFYWTKTTRNLYRSRYCSDQAGEQEIKIKHSDKGFHDEICGDQLRVRLQIERHLYRN
jgi:hypothetical protein